MRLAHIKNFGRELVTNADRGDVPQDAATVFENLRADKLGQMRGIRGYKLFANGPAAIAGNLDFIAEVVINDTQTLIAWGTDGSSVQHFYYSIDAGVNWVEITEIVFVEIDTFSSSTQFTITAGSSPFGDTPSSTIDFYNKWMLYHYEVGTPANSSLDYILDYDGISQIDTKYGISATGTSGDKIVLMRFPLWSKADLEDLADGTISNFNDHRNFVKSTFKPSVIQRQDAVAIVNGRKKDNLTAGIDNHTGIWFGYLETGNLFDQSDLSFTGLHAEKLFLDNIVPSGHGVGGGNLILTVTAAAGTPSIDAADYSFKVSFVYDGFQESPVFIESGGVMAQKNTIASGEKFTAFNIQWGKPGSFLEYHIQSRRLTSIRVYAAQVDSDLKPTTPFFFIKEFNLVDTTWSGATTHTFSSTIDGAEWTDSQDKDAASVHGYFDTNNVVPDFVVKAAGREIAGSVVVGTETDNDENTSYLIKSPINSVLRNTPDVLPEGDIKDTAEEGIYKIQGLKELGNKVACFGQNKLVLYSFNNRGDLAVSQEFDKKGLPGNFGSTSIKDFLFWGSDYSIYGLVDGGLPQEIGAAIRDTWQELSAANRQNAIAAYHRSQDEFYLLANDISYIFDKGKGTWKTYNADKTWTWLTDGVDGELLASDGTDIYDLQSATATESLTATYEKDFEFETEVTLEQFWLNFESTTMIKVFLYDLEISNSNPLDTLFFLPQSTPETIKERATFKVQRLRVKIEKQASTDQDFSINSYSIFGTISEPESESESS